MIAYMKSAVKSRDVLVACPGGKVHKRLVRLRRYEWSDTEGAFLRVDGQDDQWFLRKSEDGVEQYPRPSFECPKCEKSAFYVHDNFQAMLQRGAMGDGVIFI